MIGHHLAQNAAELLSLTHGTSVASILDELDKQSDHSGHRYMLGDGQFHVFYQGSGLESSDMLSNTNSNIQRLGLPTAYHILDSAPGINILELPVFDNALL